MHRQDIAAFSCKTELFNTLYSVLGSIFLAAFIAWLPSCHTISMTPAFIEVNLGSRQLGCNLSQLCTWLTPMLGVHGMAHLHARHSILPFK